MSTQTAPKRKVVVTKAFLRKVVNLSAQRYVAPRKKDPMASISHCRDVYWSKNPHHMVKTGKAIAVYGHCVMGSRNWGEQQYLDYVKGLCESQLHAAVNNIASYLESQKLKAQPNQAMVPSSAASTEDDQQAAQGAQSAAQTQAQQDPAFDPGSVGGGVTALDFDEVPAGFFRLEKHWIGYTDIPKVVDVDNKHQLIARVKQAIMAISQCRTVRGLEDGDLDMDRLVDIGSGSNLNGLYQQTKSGRSLDVACQIYIDMSGSMSGAGYTFGPSKSVLVNQLCAALGFVLDTLRIPFQIIGFWDSHVLLKGFNTRFNSSLFWHYDRASSGTHLSDALMDGFPLLSERREKRKIAFVLIDEDVGSYGGMPAPIGVRRSFPAIETCGFGIGDVPFAPNSFDYQITGLTKDLVETVSNTITQVIAQPERLMRRV